MTINNKLFHKNKKMLLKQLFIDIASENFSEKTLILSAKKCKLSKGYLGRLLPKGLYDVKKFYFNEVEKEMIKNINKYDYSKIRIRDKIFNGVIIRLEILNKNKEAVKKIIASETNKPINTMKNLWKISDIIWISAGDMSTDYNYYTKRLLLSWVYFSTILFWLNIKENNLTKTKLFLDRRIEEVLKFGKKSGKLKSIVNNANISNKIINLIKEFNYKKTSS